MRDFHAGLFQFLKLLLEVVDSPLSRIPDGLLQAFSHLSRSGEEFLSLGEVPGFQGLLGPLHETDGGTHLDPGDLQLCHEGLQVPDPSEHLVLLPCGFRLELRLHKGVDVSVTSTPEGLLNLGQQLPGSQGAHPAMPRLLYDFLDRYRNELLLSIPASPPG